MSIPKIAYLPPIPGTARSRPMSAFLKFLLPTLAMVAASAVVLWPQLLHSFHIATASAIPLKLQGDAAVNAAIHPIYHGVDRNGQRYTLKATRGEEIALHTYMLENPILIYYLQAGGIIHIAAQAGTYHYKEQKIYLQKDVHLTHSLGYDFTTTRAVIDVEKSIISGDDLVKGQAPTGNIESLGFHAVDKGNRIIFGKSKVHFHG